MEKSCFIVAEAEENAFPSQKSLAQFQILGSVCLCENGGIEEEGVP